MADANQIEVPDKLHEYTSFSSAINLVADSPDGDQPARVITIVAGSGTITVDMTSAANKTLTVAAGDELLGKFTGIDSVSGVTNVRVGW